MRSRLHFHARRLALQAVAAAALTGSVLAAAAQPGTAAKPPGPALPDTPAGMTVAAYFAAFNSANDSAIQAFFSEHVSPAALAEIPADQRLKRTKRIQERLGRLDLRRVTVATDSVVTVLAHASSGDWVQLSFQFEPETPHPLVGIRVEDTDPPEEQAGPRPSNDTELVKAIDSLVSKLVQTDQFSGVVLLARGDTPLFLRAYGLADRSLGVPNRIDTRFNLGSINKLFTTIVIGQLLEQGKLSLGDTIGKFLADYPNREAAAKVTVKQLLEMTSGIGDFFGERFQATPKSRLRTVHDYFPLFADKPLQFEPGTKQNYSNGGFVVLGAIIEKASGQDYYGYVRDHIFTPLAMASTDSYEADAVVPNLAMGYSLPSAGEPLRSNIYTRPARGSSAGGGYSTAEDLLRFSLALQGGTLLKPDTVRGLLGELGPAAPTEGLPSGRIGGGWAGGAPGINAALEVDPKTGTTIVVLANFDPPAAIRVAKRIRTWMRLSPD